jgi:hypothetical protein
VIDLRVYRAAFLPTAIAIVALMFSVEATPQALEPTNAGTAVTFDARRAAALAREIAETAPDRSPGSEGDAAIADLVAERLREIPSGMVSEQPYDASFDGDDVELRNVILTLPGASDRTIVIVAHRDTAIGPDSTSTAAATGMLVHLAEAFGRTSHDDTLVFISTDGGSDGASGVLEFLDAYPTREHIDAVVVLAQPGAEDPTGPHVVALSSGPESSSIQLVESAKAAVENAGHKAGLPGLAASLVALAIPSGLGEQAPVIADGTDAVTVSGAGERPSHGSEAPSPKSIGEFGRAAFALVAALDNAPPPAHGPSDYLVTGDNLIPGWPLALLALTLLLPAAALAIDALARSIRRNQPVVAALIWTVTRAIPLFAVLVLVYLLALVGIAPAPDFPFDPARFEVGFRAVAVLLVLAVALIVGFLVARPMNVPRRVDREALCPALGVVSALAVLGVWLINPYLALLLVPFAHLWILGARPNAPVPLPVTVVVTLLAAIPLAAAIAHVVGRLDLGSEAPWQLLLMLTGGQTPFLIATAGCLLGGVVLGVLAISRTTQATPQPRS